jgi:hypothetical protein
MEPHEIELWKMWQDESEIYSTYIMWLPDHVLEDVIQLSPPFFERNRSERWEWNFLSKNPAFSAQYIQDHMELPWELSYVSLNPSLTREFILRNWEALSYSESLYGLVDVQYLDEDIIQKIVDSVTPDTEKLIFEVLSSCKTLTPEILQLHLSRPWDWFHLSRNSRMTLEFIQSTLKSRGYRWSWSGMSENPNLTLEFIEQNLHRFDSVILSGNINITPEFVELHPDYEWEYMCLSFNSFFTFDYVQKNMNRDWYYYGLCSRFSNIIDLIEKHPDFPWDWKGISLNPSLTFSFIEENIDRLYIPSLSSNPVITPYFVEKHPEYVWSFVELSSNPNIMQRF